MRFLVIDGCPAPRSVGAQIHMVLDRAGQTASSIYRGTDPAGVKILHANGKHTQAEIHNDPRYRAISNPPGFSQHELFDGNGHPIPEWHVGVDSGTDSQTDKDNVTAAAAHFGWTVIHPYTKGVEGHHWCFSVEPKPTNDRQRARIQELKAELADPADTAQAEKAAGKAGKAAGKVAAQHAKAGPVTDASDTGIDLIAGFEGFVGHVYRDTVGVETIGYGETDRAIIAKYRQDGITEPAARLLLERRIHQNYAPTVTALKLPLTQPMFDALVSFVYNLGVGMLGGDHDIGKALRAAGAASDKDSAKAWRRAADTFLEYDKAGSPPRALAGLTRRRQAERALFLKGVAK